MSDPSTILRFRDRQYGSELLAVAVLDLNLFTWLDENPNANAQVMCDHFGLSKRPADVMLTLCRASGLIEDSSEGMKLTNVGREHLTDASPWSLKPYFKPIADSPIVNDFASILRTGKPANWQAKSDGADWHESMHDEEFANDFTNLMNCRGLAMGQVLAKEISGKVASCNHLLDVAGGSGVYASTMVARHSHLRATVLEQAPVDKIAEREIQRHRLSDRISVVSCDMFTDQWPSDVDAILFSNVLHDWDVPEVRQLLSIAANALPIGGLLIIHDAFINATKTGPLAVAEYSALLMNITQGKCYSVKEYSELLQEAGFRAEEYQPTTGDRGFMTAIRDTLTTA